MDIRMHALSSLVTEDHRYVVGAVRVEVNTVWHYIETPAGVDLKQLPWGSPQQERSWREIADQVRMLIDTDPLASRLAKLQDYELAIFGEPSTYEFEEIAYFDNDAACGWTFRGKSIEFVFRYRNRVARLYLPRFPHMDDSVISTIFNAVKHGIDSGFDEPLPPALFYPGSYARDVNAPLYVSEDIALSFGGVEDQAMIYISRPSSPPAGNAVVLPMKSGDSAMRLYIALRAPWIVGYAFVAGTTGEKIADQLGAHIPEEIAGVLREHYYGKN